MKVFSKVAATEEADRILAIGEYVFKVESATTKANTKSADGEQTNLVLSVQGKNRKYKLYPVLGNWTGGASTIKAFLDTIGLDSEDEDADYEPRDFVGKLGKLRSKLGKTLSGTPKGELAYFIPLLPNEKLTWADDAKQQSAPKPNTVDEYNDDTADVNDDVPF